MWASAHGLQGTFTTLCCKAHTGCFSDQTVSSRRRIADGAKEKLDNAIEQTADCILKPGMRCQGVRDSTVQGNDLALAISTLGQELSTDSANHRPAFRVAVEGEARNLRPILPDEIYKTAAEACRTRSVTLRARRIEAEIRYDTDGFQLRVRDDGKGVDPSNSLQPRQ